MPKYFKNQAKFPGLNHCFPLFQPLKRPVSTVEITGMIIKGASGWYRGIQTAAFQPVGILSLLAAIYIFKSQRYLPHPGCNNLCDYEEGRDVRVSLKKLGKWLDIHPYFYYNDLRFFTSCL